MKIGSVKIFLLVFFITLSNIHAVDITESGIETYLRGEYNRVSNYYGDISVIGSLELNNLFNFRLGISLTTAPNSININTHASAAITPFLKTPLEFRAIYIYSGIPDYEINTHTILPLVSFNAARAGISLGVGLRFTSFFNEGAQFESILSASVYFNLINSDNLRIGISVANFNEFQIKNFGAYSLKVDATIRLDSHWQIINEIELMQSGGDGLSTVFFGFGWRGGVRYTW